MRKRLEPQTGTAFRMSKGQHLLVVDLEGGQVGDLVAFSSADLGEWLSSGRSIDYAGTVYLTTNHVLYSNRSNPMLTILSDEVGRHDFLLTACSPETFKLLYNCSVYHPSCFENLATNLGRFGVNPDSIPTTFNIFMNVIIRSDGTIDIRPPLSRANDSITFRAEMDLIIGLTACSAELSNNGKFKPVGYEVY